MSDLREKLVFIPEKFTVADISPFRRTTTASPAEISNGDKRFGQTALHSLCDLREPGVDGSRN